MIFPGHHNRRIIIIIYPANAYKKKNLRFAYTLLCVRNLNTKNGSRNPFVFTYINNMPEPFSEHRACGTDDTECDGEHDDLFKYFYFFFTIYWVCVMIEIVYSPRRWGREFVRGIREGLFLYIPHGRRRIDLKSSATAHHDLIRMRIRGDVVDVLTYCSKREIVFYLYIFFLLQRTIW